MTSNKTHIPQNLKQQALSTNNLVKKPKTELNKVPNLKLPPKNDRDKEKNSSLSRKIYIVTDNDDHIVEGLPTAKHTFMSEQVEMNGEKEFDGFYSSRKKDEKQQEKDNKRAKFEIEPDMKSDVNNDGKGPEVNSKGQKSRFYYKAEEYDSLDQVEIASKKNSVKQPSVKEQSVKRQSQKPQSVKQQSVKLSVKIIKESIKPQSVKKNSKIKHKNAIKLHIQMNKQQSPYAPLEQDQSQSSPFKKKRPAEQTEQFTPDEQQPNPTSRQSRFSNHQPRSGSPLQQSHQKLFNKCYKQTYSHLKLMLNEIHQSQQHMHILHKQITNTVFDVIKDRAQAIRQEMSDLIDQIVTQWIKDEWEFLKTNQIKFMDDILEIQQQLEKREQEINVLVEKLVKVNRDAQYKEQQQQIFATFNGKSIKNPHKTSRTQTSWKMITTDLLMFNYESNIIQIQELIDKISQSAFQKCNNATQLLPSSEMFAKNRHLEILNPQAKNWFRNSVLMFMNDATAKGGNKPGTNRNSPKKSYQKHSPTEYYPQDVVNKANQHQSSSKRKQTSPKQKLYLDKTYFVSG